MEIAKDFKEPQEIIREALSNCWDARASRVYIKFDLARIPGTQKRKIMVEVGDDGEGMSAPARRQCMVTPEPLFPYDAFASYATDPDRDLVRAVEAFVEGFHRRPSLPQPLKHELQLCVDGRDFRIPRRGGRIAVTPQTVGELVESYMKLSRALVVFCGPMSRDHPWINYEIRWWLANRPGAPIYFALTHGASVDSANILPAALLEVGGADLPIFFDLRNFYQSRQWPKWFRFGANDARGTLIARDAASWTNARPFGEEAAKLVARLLADVLGGDIAVSEIEQAWANDEYRAQRLRRWLGIGIGLILLIFAATAIGLRMQVATFKQEAACLSAQKAQDSYYRSDERFYPGMPKEYIDERIAQLEKDISDACSASRLDRVKAIFWRSAT